MCADFLSKKRVPAHRQEAVHHATPKKNPMNVVYTDVFVQIQEEKEKIDLLWQETGWTARLDVSHHVGL